MSSRTGCSFFDVRDSADCLEPVSVTSAAQRAVDDAYYRTSEQSTGTYEDLPSAAARRQYDDDDSFAFDADPEVSFALSPMSSYAESSAAFGNNMDSDEPFDTSSESERLMKIHDLAEQIMASEAASRVSSDVAAATAAGTNGTLPWPQSSQTSLSKTLAESPLMPLAEAAGSSVRAGIVGSSDKHKETLKEETPQKQVPKRSHSDGDSSSQDYGSDVSVAAADPPMGSSTPAVASSQQSRGRRRKAAPFKSPTADDPTFKGAVVHMRLQMVRGQPQLKMEHYYNNMQRRRRGRPVYAEQSESEAENHLELAGIGSPDREEKQCASCSTKLTPLWRDAEDGTPLCNACGIRYKKYKVRCSSCWHIPKKNENTRSNCGECGGTLRFMVRKAPI